MYDEYQISTSEFESVDSEIFLSSEDDAMFTNTWPALPSHKISHAGKRRDFQHLPHMKSSNKSYSPDINEFPALTLNTNTQESKFTNDSLKSPDANTYSNRVYSRHCTSFDEIRSKTPGHYERCESDHKTQNDRSWSNASIFSGA